MGPDANLLSEKRTAAVLYGAILATVLVYMLPSHGFVGRPIMWISTLAHELGHGITGWLSGGSFSHFDIYPKGGGTAYTAGKHHALICAGGLLGPAIVAGAGFVLARRPRVAQACMLIMGAALLVLTVLVAGNWLAMVFMPLLAAILIGIAARKNPQPAQIGLVFVSTQLALSVFTRGDYLFKKEAVNARGTSPSDVAHVANALGGPYWFWGLVIGAFSILCLVLGLWLFTRAYPELRMRKASGISGLRARPRGGKGD